MTGTSASADRRQLSSRLAVRFSTENKKKAEQKEILAFPQYHCVQFAVNDTELYNNCPFYRWEEHSDMIAI